MSVGTSHVYDNNLTEKQNCDAEVAILNRFAVIDYNKGNDSVHGTIRTLEYRNDPALAPLIANLKKRCIYVIDRIEAIFKEIAEDVGRPGLKFVFFSGEEGLVESRPFPGTDGESPIHREEFVIEDAKVRDHKLIPELMALYTELHLLDWHPLMK